VFNIKVERKCDAERVGLREHLPEGAGPDLADVAHHVVTLGVAHRELDVVGAATHALAGADRPPHVVDQLAVGVVDAEVRGALGVSHVHLAKLVALRVLDVDGVVAAALGAPAAALAAPERPLDADHLLLVVVGDVHDEASVWAAADAVARV